MNEVIPYPQLVSSVNKITYWTPAANCLSPTVTNWSVVLPFQWTRSGSDLPNYRDLIAAGLNATTSFTGTRRFIDRKGYGSYYRKFRSRPSWGSCWWKEYTGFGDIWHSLPTYSSVPISTDSAYAMARSKVIKQAKELLSPVQGAVALGELGKTLRMISNPALGLRNVLKSYNTRLKKAETRKSALSRRRELSSAYLELQMGWLPLASDVNGGIKALNAYTAKRPFEIRRVVGKGKVQGFSSWTAPSQNTAYSPVLSISRSERYFSVWTRGGVKLKASGSGQLVQNLGVLPEDFLPTAWELLPYSFLIDYFANIGDIIDAFSLINGNMAWMCETTRNETNAFIRTHSLKPHTYQSYVTSEGLSHCEAADRTITVSRQSLLSIIPPLDFRLPGFHSRKWWNITALLFQQGPRRPYY